MKLPILLAALILTGCAARRPGDTVDSVAEQKRNAQASSAKQRARENAALRVAVRNLYVNDHPEMSPDIRKAILKEEIKKGMNVWQAIAAYSLWDYTTDPGAARYKSVGAPALWNLLDRRQTTTGQTTQEQWVLMRQKETQYLLFENGRLTTWKGSQ